MSGLIDLFLEITEYNNTKELIWDHLTNFLIENVIEGDVDANMVKSKYISSKSIAFFMSIEIMQEKF